MQYKKIIVWIVLISCIIAGTMDIINMKPGQASRAMLTLYFCIPLVSLALTNSSKIYVKIGGFIITLLLLALSKFSIYPLIGAAVFVGGSILSLLRHNTLLKRRKEITPWGLAIVHSATFCMVCAVAGSFSIMGKGDKIDVTCDEVRGFINQHMSSVLTPIGITTGQMNNIQVWVDGFFTKSTDEVIQEQVTNQISSQLGGIAGGTVGQLPQQLDNKAIADISKLLKSIPQGSGKSAGDIAALLKSNPQIAAMLQSNTPPDVNTANNPLAKKLQDRAKSKLVITDTVGDKQELDDKICTVVFDQIKMRSTLPGFTLSILVSLIFFFYPLIRLFAYFYAGFLSLIYIILRQTGFISVVPEEKIVDTRVVGDGYQGNTILSTLAFESKIASQAAKKVVPPVQRVVENTTPPKPPIPPVTTTGGGNDINDMLGSFEETEGSKAPNTPQDTIAITPPQTDSPHVDFGSFGGNFDKKPQRKDKPN